MIGVFRLVLFAACRGCCIGVINLILREDWPNKPTIHAAALTPLAPCAQSHPPLFLFDLPIRSGLLLLLFILLKKRQEKEYAAAEAPAVATHCKQNEICERGVAKKMNPTARACTIWMRKWYLFALNAESPARKHSSGQWEGGKVVNLARISATQSGAAAPCWRLTTATTARSVTPGGNCCGR